MALKTGRANEVAQVTINQSDCIACGLCVQVCKGAPLHVVSGIAGLGQLHDRYSGLFHKTQQTQQEI